MEKLRIDLQFHPYVLVNYTVDDILKTMEKKGLDALALLHYDWEEGISLQIAEQMAENLPFSTQLRYSLEKWPDRLVFHDRTSGKKKILILGQEACAPKQRWHVLSIGADGISPAPLPVMIEQIIEKGGIPIIDHPFADPQRKFRDIEKDKILELSCICRRYKGRIALEWNSYSLPQIRKLLPGYSDSNGKAEKLASLMKIPLIPTTDLHAKNKKALWQMGKSWIECDVDIANPVESLKKNILEMNFESCKGYVSLYHFMNCYAYSALKKSNL